MHGTECNFLPKAQYILMCSCNKSYVFTILEEKDHIYSSILSNSAVMTLLSSIQLLIIPQRIDWFHNNLMIHKACIALKKQFRLLQIFSYTNIQTTIEQENLHYYIFNPYTSAKNFHTQTWSAQLWSTDDPRPSVFGGNE